MVILGIDPGYAIIGWGVVEYTGNRFRVLDYGAVTTDPDMDFPARLQKIYLDVTALIVKWKPDSMAVEQLFWGANTTTAICVAEARGCILLAAAENNLFIGEYTPLQIKQSVTGYGKAVKEQVMEMTKLILKLREIPKPDDTADALAVAICHAHSAGSLMSKYLKR